MLLRKAQLCWCIFFLISISLLRLLGHRLAVSMNRKERKIKRERERILHSNTYNITFCSRISRIYFSFLAHAQSKKYICERENSVFVERSKYIDVKTSYGRNKYFRKKEKNIKFIQKENYQFRKKIKYFCKFYKKKIIRNCAVGKIKNGLNVLMCVEEKNNNNSSRD